MQESTVSAMGGVDAQGDKNLGVSIRGVAAQDDKEERAFIENANQNQGVYASDKQNQQREGASIGDYDQNQGDYAIHNQDQQREEVINKQREIEGAYVLGDDAIYNQNQESNGALNHQREGDCKAICDQNQQRHALGADNHQREGALNHCSIDEVLKRWVGEFGRAQIVHFTLTSLAWSLEALHTLVTIFADKTPPWRCINDDACTPSSSLCGLAPGVWEWVHKHESTVSEWNLVCESSYMQGLAQSSFFIGCLLGAGLCGHLADSKLGRRGALALACMLNAVCGMLTAASPNYVVYTLLRAATGICSGGLGLTSFVLGTECIGPSRRTSAAMSALYFYPLGVLLLASLATSTSHYSWRILYLVTSIPSVLYCLFVLPFLAESPRWYLVRGRTHEALQVLKAIAKKNGTVVPARIVLSVEDQDDDNDDKLKCDHHHDAGNMNTTMPLRQLRTQDGLAAHEELEMQQIEFTEINERIKVTNVTNAQKVDGKAARGTLMDVFRSNDTRIRMVILVVVWLASALGYYAFNLNVGNLGTNLTMSVVLNALAEVPGYAVATGLCHRVGRRITLISALLLSAFSSLLGAIISYRLSPHTSTTFLSHFVSHSPPFFTLDPVPQSTLPLHALASYNTTTHHDPYSISKAHLRSFVQLICSLVGLFSIAGTYNLLYLYTAELFPTVVRNAALGLATQAGSIGSIIAPIVVFSAHVNITLPFFIIGVATLLSGVMAIKLPETLNRPFHETLEGMRRAKDEA